MDLVGTQAVLSLPAELVYERAAAGHRVGRPGIAAVPEGLPGSCRSLWLLDKGWGLIEGRSIIWLFLENLGSFVLVSS